MEEIKNLLKDCECYGHRCPHEISGKHYVIILEDVDSIIDLAVSKEREKNVEIVKAATPQHITREYRDTDKMRDDIISLINTK